MGERAGDGGRHPLQDVLIGLCSGHGVHRYPWRARPGLAQHRLTCVGDLVHDDGDCEPTRRRDGEVQARIADPELHDDYEVGADFRPGPGGPTLLWAQHAGWRPRSGPRVGYVAYGTDGRLYGAGGRILLEIWAEEPPWGGLR